MSHRAESAQDYIRNTFAPVVTALCSSDAEAITQKNNLSFVEMIRPFCCLNTEAHIKDPNNQLHTIRGVRIIVNDMNWQPPPTSVAKKLLNEVVANCQLTNPTDGNIVSVGDYNLQINSSSPWYECYRDTFLQLMPPFDHEFLRHSLACMLVVSTNNPDPMDQFQKLNSQQHHHQHIANSRYPKWFLPNIFKYYVLVHDVADGDDERANAIYNSMKSYYGGHVCHFLQINSRPLNQTDQSPVINQQFPVAKMPDPWQQFLNKTIDTSSRECLDLNNDISPPGESAFPDKVTEGDNSIHSLSSVVDQISPGEGTDDMSFSRTDPPPHVTRPMTLDRVQSSSAPLIENRGGSGLMSTVVSDHPLSPCTEVIADEDGLPSIPTPSLTHHNSLLDSVGVGTSVTPPLQPLYSSSNPLSSGALGGGVGGDKSEAVHGICLTVSDHDRLRIFLYEFVIRGLIPFMERNVRLLNEQVTSRKGIHRTFFSATKKWFSGGSRPNPGPSSTTGTGIGLPTGVNNMYTSESPELQMRRLADLSFLIQMYELAHQAYYACKRDSNSGHAWLYFAGALEMAALSVFLQTNTQRQYPVHYMDTAIQTYLNTCGNMELSTRAILLNSECLKSKGMYSEAASEFISMTSEDFDLRSALLLEQAAHCFINMKPPRVRKYAFHMILAGHRFSKAGQKKHTLRSYSQALQVFKSRHWSFAEDHINFTIGRQSFNLKQLENAAAAFKHLLTTNSKQTAPQQTTFLREYLFVFKLSGQQTSVVSCNTPVPNLSLPTIHSNETKVLLGSANRTLHSDNETPATGVTFDQLPDVDERQQWALLEQAAISFVRGGRLPWKPTVQCFTQQTKNTESPIGIVEEPLSVEIVLHNPLKISLSLSDLKLLWKFYPSSLINQSHVSHDDLNDDIINVITNDDPDSSMVETAEQVIHTEVIREFVLAGNETRAARLSISPQQTGQLQILGTSYCLASNTVPNLPPPVIDKLKTQQSKKSTPPSSTGVSVAGKQLFQIQGPRLNSNMAERSSKKYGADRRLDPIVAAHMPLLEVLFYDMPSDLFCGEVKRVSVKFVNSGREPLYNLHVSSNTPQFFTFSSQNSPPPHTGDSSQKHEPTTTTTTSGCVVDADMLNVCSVCKICLPGDVLNPGHSVTLTLCLRGLDTAGVHEIDFIFYYEPLNKHQSSSFQLTHRVVRHRAIVTMHNSLNVCAIATRKCSNKLLLSLEAINMNQIDDQRIVEFHIEQVCGVSEHWIVEQINVNNNNNKQTTTLSGESVKSVQPSESLLSHYKASRVDTAETESELSPKKLKLKFSNVLQHSVDCSIGPCKEFYFRSRPEFIDKYPKIKQTPTDILHSNKHKHSNNNNNNNNNKLCTAASHVDLTLIVIWRAFVVDEHNTTEVIGQHHVYIETLDKRVSTLPRTLAIEDPQQAVKFVKEPASPSRDPVSHSDVALSAGCLVNYSLKHSSVHIHSFSMTRLCRLPVTLVLHNSTDYQITVTVNLGDNGSVHRQMENTSQLSTTTVPTIAPSNYSLSSSFSWIGQTVYLLTLSRYETQTLLLSACFCTPGTYNLNNISVNALLTKVKSLTFNSSTPNNNNNTTQQKEQTNSVEYNDRQGQLSSSDDNNITEEWVSQTVPVPSLVVISNYTTNIPS